MAGEIVFQTVISGVIIFVVGDIIQKFVLEPYQKYKGIIGKIDNELKFYANTIANPGTLEREPALDCSKALRRLSCDLEATYKQIPFRRISARQKISDSARRLILLSNNLFVEKSSNTAINVKTMERIRENLNIQAL